MNTIKNNWLILQISSIIFALLSFFSELIPVNNGFGWDGQKFAFFTQNFFQLIQSKNFDGYYIQRLLPFFSTRCMIDLYHFILRIPKEISTLEIIYAYKVLNYALMVHGMHIWLKTTSTLKWSSLAVYFSIILLYVNFFALKEIFYYPVNTDVFALYIGIVILYAYVHNHFRSLIALTLLSLIIIPKIGLILGGVLLLFHGYKTGNKPIINIQLNKVIQLGLLLVVNAAYLALCYQWLFKDQTLGKYLILSITLSCLYLNVVLLFIYKIIPKSIDIQKKGILNISCIILGYIIISSLLKQFSTAEYLDSLGFLQNIIESANENPLGHLTAGIYFGGIFIIYLLLMPKTINEYNRKLSLNEVILLGIILLLGVNSETRQFLIFFPFIIYIIVKQFNNSLTIKLTLSSLVINFLICRIWLPINVFGSIDSNHHRNIVSQLWFMNHGPWLDKKIHLIGLLLLFAFYVLIYKGLSFRNSLNKNNVENS